MPPPTVLPLAPAVLILARGGVGIGTNTPQGTLQIGPTETFHLVIRPDSSIEAFEDSETIPVAIGTNGGGAFIGGHLRVAGNVGIGATSPSNPLSVEQSGAEAGGVFGFAEVVARVRNTSAGAQTALSVDAPSGQDAILYLSENGSAEWDVRSDVSSGALQVRHHGVANTTPMVIETGGNVGIGTNTPSGKLHVAGAPGNGSVVLPDDSISAEETLNEPGLAFEVALNFKHEGGLQTVQSLTIDCPAPGYIHAIATGATSALVPFDQLIILGLSLQPTSIPLPNEHLETVTTRFRALTIQEVFQVQAGQHTVHFLMSSDKDYRFQVFKPRIALIYLPTAYGIVTTD